MRFPIPRPSVRLAGAPALVLIAAALSSPALADPMDMPMGPAPAPGQPHVPAPDAASPPTHDMADMPGMEMGQMKMMAGMLGAYSMMRDASGTAWQPGSTPMRGMTWSSGGWSGMVHGYADLVHDHQNGPRGATETFSESMLMVMAQHAAGPGTLTLKTMLSLDPAMGRKGYPLLLQTGETADGLAPLVDRQHPHNLFMELAGVYSLPVGATSSVFLYAGFPGEPALGPVTFMHRFSGEDDPGAPITHHWLDSTHITFGVLTTGFVHGPWKVEGSVFNGREPDQHRWGFQRLRLDSWSGRITFNPTDDWSFQTSYGFLHSPEQLAPDVDQHRLTASATYNRPLARGNWQTTFAWGRNYEGQGHALDGLLLESALAIGRSTVFARAETVEKDDLVLAPSPLDGRTFRVSEASLGYVYDIPVAPHVALGLGVQGRLNFVPTPLKTLYGSGEPAGYMPFVRLEIR